MPRTGTVEDLDIILDILGQQPGLQIYTQICLCFSVVDESSYSTIINVLTDGLERLSASFPWVAGQIVNEDVGEGNTGVFKIKSLEKIPRFVVKDLRHDPSIPSIDTLRRANFPFSMLDENVVAPRNTLPGSSGESALVPAPVFLVQANFIKGGLLLTFVGHHMAMDMTGQGQIIHLISKACRNEPFTSEELSSGNLAGHNLIPLLDEDSYDQGSALAHQLVKPSPSHIISSGTTGDQAPPPPPKCTWTYFTFTSTSLTALKSIAAKTITLPSGGYISTDDALTAFIWQSTIRARLPRLSPTVESTLARAVDPRRYVDISPTYAGIVQNMTYHTEKLQNLVEEPLGSVASKLRFAVDPKTSNLRHSTRAIATYLSRNPDKNTFSVTAAIDASRDIMLSSWANIDCYQLDFNLGLGKPEAVRRPQFDPCEGLMYLMPRKPDGEIVVGICLRDEDIERLKVDEEFTRYGTHIP
jgi:trichothecene 3-O-acetyltransferase